MTDAELKAENEKLRAEIESYRQRELAELKQQLAAVREAAEHYRSEAHRNAEAVRQVNALAEETINRLKAQLEVAQKSQLESVRNRPRAVAGGNR